ncbi:MAG: LysM peptidoglycan-binding domain-containing protein [Caldilineales bacterium]
MKHIRQTLIALTLLFVTGFAALPAAAAPLSQEQTVYEVKAGDTLTQIALRFGVSQQELMAANGITNPSLIYTGQTLVIPGADAQPAAQQPATSEPALPAVHIVKAGETLSAIAAQYGLTTAELAAANNLTNPSLIRTGGRLRIPGGDAAAEPASSAAQPAIASAPAAAEYVVGAGDTLASIAQEYGTTVAAIASANGITNPSQILRASVWRSRRSPRQRPAPRRRATSA